MKLFGKRKNSAKASAEPEKKHQQDARIHNEGLGHIWHALTGLNPEILMPQIVSTVLTEGGTRPSWKWKSGGLEYIAMAWPEKEPVRACVLMCGPEVGQLKPVTAVPLLEGLPNDLTIEAVHPRGESQGADVASLMQENKNPMWFFDPFYKRDATDLTPGVTHTFWLSGLALALRKAVLDKITLVQGPQYEEYAKTWLAENPGRKSHEVPPLELEIRDRHFIMPGQFFGEYKLRAPIEKIEECRFEKMQVQICYLDFPFPDRQPLHLPVFVSKFVLQDYVPQVGDEIEAYVWFQGRIIDLET